jgi:hypothetical protein
MDDRNKSESGRAKGRSKKDQSRDKTPEEALIGSINPHGGGAYLTITTRRLAALSSSDVASMMRGERDQRSQGG